MLVRFLAILLLFSNAYGYNYCESAFKLRSANAQKAILDSIPDSYYAIYNSVDLISDDVKRYEYVSKVLYTREEISALSKGINKVLNSDSTRIILGMPVYGSKKVYSSHLNKRLKFFDSLMRDTLFVVANFASPVPIAKYINWNRTSKIYRKLWDNPKVILTKEEIKLLNDYHVFNHFESVRSSFLKYPKTHKFRKVLSLSFNALKFMVMGAFSIIAYEQLTNNKSVISMKSYEKEEPSEQSVQYLIDNSDQFKLYLRVKNNFFYIKKQSLVQVEDEYFLKKINEKQSDLQVVKLNLDSVKVAKIEKKLKSNLNKEYLDTDINILTKEVSEELKIDLSSSIKRSSSHLFTKLAFMKMLGNRAVGSFRLISNKKNVSPSYSILKNFYVSFQEYRFSSGLRMYDYIKDEEDDSIDILNRNLDFNQ